MTTTPLKLTYISETTLARLYQNEKCVRKWVPKSVIKRCVGPTPKKNGDTHELEIEDWWLEENPWETPPQDQPKLL